MVAIGIKLTVSTVVIFCSLQFVYSSTMNYKIYTVQI